MTPLTIVVEPVSATAWTLTCAEVPGWSATATSPLHLGLLIRDAYGQLTSRLRYLQRVNATLGATHQAYLCPSCGDVITRTRRGRPQVACAGCRTARHLQPVTNA